MRRGWHPIMDSAGEDDLRDGATCIRAPRSATEAMAEQRGYADLDPEACWEQWQAVRTELVN